MCKFKEFINNNTLHSAKVMFVPGIERELSTLFEMPPLSSPLVVTTSRLSRPVSRHSLDPSARVTMASGEWRVAV